MLVMCKNAVIAPTSAAFKAGGQAGEPIKVMLDIYPSGPEQISEILGLRGKELVIVMATVDHESSMQALDRANNGEVNERHK